MVANQLRRGVPADMKDRLIVALDVSTVQDAIKIVHDLEGVVSFFKIGFWLCMAEGVDELYKLTTSDGRKLFLDAKLYDVPETIRQAVTMVIKRGATFVTVHGDAGIMKAAVDAKKGSDLKILAVTVLTNLDDNALRDMGYAKTARDLVMLRARNAVQADCDGIIASADDDPDRIRELAGSADLLIATPGIRFKGGDTHDQKRVATPREAIRHGADYLVVGRPIIEHENHPDMKAAALAVIADMEAGWRERQAQGEGHR